MELLNLIGSICRIRLNGLMRIFKIGYLLSMSRSRENKLMNRIKRRMRAFE